MILIRYLSGLNTKTNIQKKEKNVHGRNIKCMQVNNDFALVILTIKFIKKSRNVLVVATRDNNYLKIISYLFRINDINSIYFTNHNEQYLYYSMCHLHLRLFVFI